MFKVPCILVFVLAVAVTPARSQPASSPLLDRITKELNGQAAEFIALRHDLHRNPEVSRMEERTARVVADRMRALGL